MRHDHNHNPLCNIPHNRHHLPLVHPGNVAWGLAQLDMGRTQTGFFYGLGAGVLVAYLADDPNLERILGIPT